MSIRTYKYKLYKSKKDKHIHDIIKGGSRLAPPVI